MYLYQDSLWDKTICIDVLISIRKFSNLYGTLSIPNFIIVYYTMVSHHGPLASVMYVKMATAVGAVIINQ